MRRALLLAMAAVLPAASAIAGSCEDELARQSSAAGIPAPLAQALASSLAIGPDGSMHPFAVQGAGRSVAERSPQAAARAASALLGRGAGEVRVGCLGASLMPGMDEEGILQALDPAKNVAMALAGIGGNDAGIGDALAAISSGAPAPAPAGDRPPAYIPPPAYAHAPMPARLGSIGGGWSLFNNGSPRPLTIP